MIIVNSAAMNISVLNSDFKLKRKQFHNLVIRLNQMQLYHHFFILCLFLGGFQKLTSSDFFLFSNSPKPGQLGAVKIHWLKA